MDTLPVNYDEAQVGIYTLPGLSLDANVPVPNEPRQARAAQAAWRQLFASGLYGALPAPPQRLDWTRTALPTSGCERIAISLRVDGRQFDVDAALWLPSDRVAGPLPTIVVMDFLGPLGTLPTDDYPLDQRAFVARPTWLGGGQGPLDPVMRGTAAHPVPIALLTAAGYAVLTSCYGSWVPDDADACRCTGVWPLLGLDQSNSPPGVVCLWSWGIQRLLDVAVALPEIDASSIAVAGHSRLGKAALWAAANDERISALFLNESGCGGAALSRRNFGESFAHTRQKFPYWLLPASRAELVGLDAVDQHQLLATLAPRRLYVASAADDLWCDPRGEYLSLKAAAPMWSAFGLKTELPVADEIFVPGQHVVSPCLGWHLRAGGHELTPYDWQRFLDFMKQ
jgi:hypothetical protein